MPFKLHLYRAAAGLGPLIGWDREHRQPLGTRGELRAALDAVLPGLRWEEGARRLFASGPFAGEHHALELYLYGAPEERLLEVCVYALPPPVRLIMTGLGLNYCYAGESGRLYEPFATGERWPADDR